MAYFVTGATGFIGRRLVERLLERKGKIHVLVREDSLGRLDELIEHWETVSEATVSRRMHPVVGDLRKPLLGLTEEQVSELEGTVDHLFHLAAVYDMTAPVELDMAVNVGGTNHAMELAAAIRAGALPSRLLDRGGGRLQRRVRREPVRRGPAAALALSRHQVRGRAHGARAGARPWRMYRPGIVVGDSKTGEMDKIDGPYYFFKAIQRMRQVVPQWMPLVGLDLGKTNIVPVDWVAARSTTSPTSPHLDGQAFHLTYPGRAGVDEVINDIAAAAHAPRFAVSVDKRVLDVDPDRPAFAADADAADAPGAQADSCASWEYPTRCSSTSTSCPLSTRVRPSGHWPARIGAPAGAARVRGQALGLLGARDGPEHQPRAHAWARRSRASAC